MPYSGSNWLNRLRLSKGFPADQNLNLEQFLNLHNPDQHSESIPNDPNLNPTPPRNPGHNRIQSPALPIDDGVSSTTMSDVLAELFVMDNYQNLPQKKGIRKQPNPRNCVLSVSPNASLPIRHANERVGLVNSSAFDDEEEDTCRTDLSAFSRTEVTVIDTSFENWKFEKMLFRRKNVWKVRDKKCKGVINVGTKKRKGTSFEDLRNEKKSKLCLGKYNSDKRAVNKGLHQNDRVEEVCKEGQDTLTKISKTRFHRKVKNGNSSVILVKNSHMPKKIVKSNAKCLPKSAQRRHQVSVE